MKNGQKRKLETFLSPTRIFWAFSDAKIIRGSKFLDQKSGHYWFSLVVLQ